MTSERMTPSELADKIAALDAQATPGPWKALETDDEDMSISRVDADSQCVVGGCGCCGSPFGDNAPNDRSTITILRNHAAVLAEALRICEQASKLIGLAAEGHLWLATAEAWCDRYRALCEEVSRE